MTLTRMRADANCASASVQAARSRDWQSIVAAPAMTAASVV